MGITLREVVFDIGGGVPDGKKIQSSLWLVAHQAVVYQTLYLNFQ